MRMPAVGVRWHFISGSEEVLPNWDVRYFIPTTDNVAAITRPLVSCIVPIMSNANVPKQQ